VRASPDGPGLAEAREYLEGRLREALRDPARLDRCGHQRLLGAATEAGSLAAAARLVDLGLWEAMREIDIARPAVAAWRGSNQALGDLVAGQVYAQLWLHHLRAQPQASTVRFAAQRDEWLQLVRQAPLRNPMLLAEAAWLYGAIEPKQPARAYQYSEQMLVALANDPAFGGDDLLLMEGRGNALTRYSWCLDEDDRLAAHAILSGAVANCAARGSIAGQAVNLLIESQLRNDWSDQSVEQCNALLVQAEALFARIGDLGRQGRCRGWLANNHHWYARRSQEVDWAEVGRTYQEAAELCRRGEDWGGVGWIAESLAGCLQGRNSQRPDDWREIGAAYAEAAAAFARVDDRSNRAYCLYSQAVSLSPDHCPGTDWREMVALHRQAEECYALTDDSYMRAYNLCALGEALGMTDDRDGARTAFRQAQALMRLGPDAYYKDLRRRIVNGLNAYTH
jgi:hypothetical protein